MKDSNKEFSLWTAKERVEEAKAVGAEVMVSACPYCRENFREAIKMNQEKLKALDITELIVKAMKIRGGEK